MQIHKVYLIAVQAIGDDQDEDGYRAGFRLDLDMVYVLDHETRTLARCEVDRRTQNSGENDQFLRIRCARTHHTLHPFNRCKPRTSSRSTLCRLILPERKVSGQIS